MPRTSREQLLTQAQVPGHSLVRRRQALGLTRQAMAERLSTDERTVSVHTFTSWEQGRRRPSAEMQWRWERAIAEADREAENQAIRKKRHPKTRRLRNRIIPTSPDKLDELVYGRFHARKMVVHEHD